MEWVPSISLFIFGVPARVNRKTNPKTLSLPLQSNPRIESCGMAMEQAPIELEVGWRNMDAGVARLKRILHGEEGASFSSEEYINLYTYVPIICGFILLVCYPIGSDLI